LADCWILSAAACLAERPKLIERLFITKEYNEMGIYKIRLCKNGEWIVVTVDDYIPCYYNGGPMFSRSTGRELWVLLLEKAYAKLHGHYYSLRFGFTHHGLMDLTGCPTETINF
jgi:calpain-15